MKATLTEVHNKYMEEHKALEKRVVHRVVPVKVIWRFAALSRFTTKNEGHPCERNLEGA